VIQALRPHSLFARTVTHNIIFLDYFKLSGNSHESENLFGLDIKADVDEMDDKLTFSSFHERNYQK